METEKRRIVVEYQTKVNVQMPKVPKEHEQDEEEFERMADRWLRRRLTRDGRPR